MANALVDVYGKYENVGFARQLFHKMAQRDVVSYNAMILGYVQNGHAGEALALFYRMPVEHVRP